MQDKHFFLRRKGAFESRLAVLAAFTDEELWLEVGRRYERLEKRECRHVPAPLSSTPLCAKARYSEPQQYDEYKNIYFAYDIVCVRFY